MLAAYDKYKESRRKSRLDPKDEQGIQWAWVGRNASHEFYLGVDAEDRLWKRNFGESFDDVGYQTAQESLGDGGVNPDEYIDAKMSEPQLIGNFDQVGYIGHY
jgi:hypothetical protein